MTHFSLSVKARATFGLPTGMATGTATIPKKGENSFDSSFTHAWLPFHAKGSPSIGLMDQLKESSRCLLRYHRSQGILPDIFFHFFSSQRPTSCVFGGKNLDVLYVTSASRDIGEPESLKGDLDGALFAIKGLGAKGFPANVFHGF